MHTMRMLIVLVLAVISMPVRAQRVELPVRQVELPNGDRRFMTTLQIDGRTVEVGIDTGSTGLRVLPRGFGPDASALHGPRVTYSYGAGTAFEGEAVTVPVSAGGVAGSIKVMRIDAVGCAAGKPDCPVAHADLSRYGIQGDGIAGQGFAAILGIRAMHDTIDNPFSQLGVHRWIVELPRKSGEVGRLILNPDEIEIATYARVRYDGEGNTPGCLAGPEKICARAYFDSGAAGLRVLRPAPFKPWANGTPATLSVGAGQEAQTMPVIIGRRDQASALLYSPSGNETRLSYGFAPYFHWSVLYDTDTHTIGLKPR